MLRNILLSFRQCTSSSARIRLSSISCLPWTIPDYWTEGSTLSWQWTIPMTTPSRVILARSSSFQKSSSGTLIWGGQEHPNRSNTCKRFWVFKTTLLGTYTNGSELCSRSFQPIRSLERRQNISKYPPSDAIYLHKLVNEYLNVNMNGLASMYR